MKLMKNIISQLKTTVKVFTQDTIENYFVWFGAPHDEGDAILGNFVSAEVKF